MRKVRWLRGFTLLPYVVVILLVALNPDLYQRIWTEGWIYVLKNL